SPGLLPSGLYFARIAAGFEGPSRSAGRLGRRVQGPPDFVGALEIFRFPHAGRLLDRSRLGIFVVAQPLPFTEGGMIENEDHTEEINRGKFDTLPHVTLSRDWLVVSGKGDGMPSFGLTRLGLVCGVLVMSAAATGCAGTTDDA